MFLIAPQLDFDLAAVWAAARDESQIKHEVLAALMGITAARLSDQLAAGLWALCKVRDEDDPPAAPGLLSERRHVS